jgi:hypothetical protein
VFAISRYSRFRGFNSRLGWQKFPIRVLWKFAGKSLICLIVFARKTAVFRGKVKNSRLNGNNREWRRYQQAGLRRAARVVPMLFR